MKDFAHQLRVAMQRRNMSQSELCEITKIPKSAMSQYLSGSFRPKQVRTYQLAEALGVSEAWLMGCDEVPMERHGELPRYDNILPISTQKLPYLGEIACGEPIFADEQREMYVLAGTDIHADFVLRAKGDSMIGARIYDGDLVFIRKQDIVDNGQIAAVVIDNEATLKRVNYYPEHNMLILKPENPKYHDMIYVGEELENIRILGLAVAFQSDVV